MGLELGANDSVVKPFSSKVLFAHIRKVLSETVQKSEISTDLITSLKKNHPQC